MDRRAPAWMVHGQKEPLRPDESTVQEITNGWPKDIDGDPQLMVKYY